MRRLLVGALLGICCAWSVPASAQSASERAAAQALFDEGRSLMGEGKLAEACPKLEESNRLDPSIGTQFNLAACYERAGKTASAWAMYLEVAAATRKQGEVEREKVARERAQALEPSLAKLSIVVPEPNRVEGMQIKRDNVEVGRALWGMAAPVDPGDIVVTASAPGKKPWTGQVSVAAGGSAQIEVPALEDGPPEPVAGAPGAAAAPGSTAAGGPAAADTGAEGSRPIPTSVYITAGVTGALAIGAVVTGIMALSKRSDFDAINDANHSEAQKQEAHDDAVSMGVVNTVLTGAALVGAGVTAVLFFTRPEQPPPERARAWVGPWATASGGGLVVGGAL
jgi:hypothetical protein